MHLLSCEDLLLVFVFRLFYIYFVLYLFCFYILWVLQIVAPESVSCGANKCWTTVVFIESVATQRREKMLKGMVWTTELMQNWGRKRMDFFCVCPPSAKKGRRDEMLWSRQVSVVVVYVAASCSLKGDVHQATPWATAHQQCRFDTEDLSLLTVGQWKQDIWYHIGF